MITFRIERIEIEGFRGIRDRLALELVDPSGDPVDLFLVAGVNGSGKTSVLESALLGLGADALILRDLPAAERQAHLEDDAARRRPDHHLVEAHQQRPARSRGDHQAHRARLTGCAVLRHQADVEAGRYRSTFSGKELIRPLKGFVYPGCQGQKGEEDLVKTVADRQRAAGSVSPELVDVRSSIRARLQLGAPA